MAGDADATYRSLLTDPSLVSVLGMVFAGAVGLQVVTPALPSVATEFGVPDERVGLVVTAFFVAAAVTLPFAGAVADMIGRRRLALVSLAVFGVPALAMPFVGGFDQFLVLRALQGAAFPGLIPLSITVAGDLYSGRRGAMAQGLRVSVTGVGSTVGPAIAGLLAGITWFYPFLLYAVSFPVLVLAFFWLPETGNAGDGNPVLATEGRLSLRDVFGYVRIVGGELRDRSLLVLVVGAFIGYFARYAVVTFLPLFAVRELGETSATGGLLLAIVGICRIAVPLFSESVVARFSRKTVLLGSLTGTATTIALLPVVPDVLGVAVVVFAYGIATSFFMPVLNETVTSLADADRRAGVVNTMELGKILALATSPVVFGIVLGLSGFTAVFVLAGLVLGGYVALALVFLEGTVLREHATDRVPG